MNRHLTSRVLFLIVLLTVCALAFSGTVYAINLTTTSSENFDSLGTVQIATLPTDWKVDKNATVRTLGTYTAAGTVTEQYAGNNMSGTATNGIYNYGAGVYNTATDRAVGWISSSSATKSGNLYVKYTNTTGQNLTGLTISYNVEKYRTGTNAAGFSIQMYYGTDGATWTSAGSNFLTSFPADATTAGYASAPGVTVAVSNQTLTFPSAIANNADFYLAWNYSVTSGTTTSSAQGLGVDDVSVTAITGTADSAPTVTGATPTNGATVATDAPVSVTFSEAVTFNSTVTINCTGSGIQNVTPTGGPLTWALPHALFQSGDSCTVTIDAADVSDTDTNDPPDNLAADFTWSFTVDAAPAVISTTPANLATNVAVSADLSVTFSEPVDVNTIDSFFDIYCDVSGTSTLQPAAGNGGPTTFTINPTADLPAGSSCTVTIKAAQVTDQDANDPPDNMAANHVFTFTTAAADAAPTVSATVPLDGATGVAAGADLSVTFSEPVDVNTIDSFFDIYCDSVPQPAAGSGGPTTFTINPTADLPAGSSCTVTIHAADVTDQDANDPPNNMAADYSWDFTVAVPVIPCDRLFFSEYIEGSSNNKALEIYNGSAAAVDLSNYTVELYANGVTIPTNTANLSGSLAAGDVYVIANSAANATILGLADLLSTVTYFNGDDALALKYNGALVDVIGQIGVRPASTLPPYEGAYWGSEPTTTLNHTLRRKVTISAGDANGSDFFDPALEWDSYAQDNIDGLGAHAATACYVPADVPPTVSSTTPSNTATDVGVAANISIVFSEPVTVSGAWYSISCASSGSHTAVASGGPSAWVLNPDVNFTLGELCTVTIVAAQVADLDAPADNMAADYVFTFTVISADPCAAPATLISTIQGSGLASTYTGSSKTIQGIVVGDYEQLGMSGYFVQEEDSDADGNPATSEGIFIYDGNADNNVALGDKVRVTGTVAEYSALTELKTITSLTVCGTGQGGLVTATPVSLPVTLLTDLEPYEGMRVTFPQVLTVTDNYDLGYSGQLTLSADGKLWQFTHQNAPSIAGYAAHLAAIALRSIVLDDANTKLDPDPIIYPGTGLTALNTVRVDDTVTGLTGVLDQFTTYRIQPIGQVNFTPANPRPTTPPAVGGAIKVGSFNTLNFFVTTGAGYTCGPYSTLQCRGASNATEYTRQLDKLVAAICGLNADVLGLMELENPDLTETTDPVLGALVTALNASPACVNDYAFIDNAWAGTDAIRQGLIYKPTVVTPVGTTAILVSTAFINGGDSSPRNRPALTQAFQVISSGERFILSVNHLKSKGSACTAPDIFDGQANCAVVRTNAANALTAWLATNPTGIVDPDILIMGDLNSYAKEDPITAFVNAGYTDLINWTVGSAGYGYAFDGMMGYLDHALGSSALLAQVTAADEWHINSPEPDVLDYNTEYKSAGQITSLYNADPYRSTDHDAVLVGLALGLNPDRSDLDASYGLAWHTGQGVVWKLGALWTGEATSTPGSDNPSDDGVVRDYSQSWNDTRGEVNVTVTGPASAWACLNAWLDYSDGSAVAGVVETPNGLFDANEHVVNNLPIQAGAGQLVTWPLESGVINNAATYNMRFRLVPAPNPAVASCSGVTLAPTAPDGGGSATGLAYGGEVEDYAFTPGPLAVDLAGFTATAAAEGVTLAWETVSETDNAGFNVYRADSEDGPWTKLNEALIASAAPGSSEGHSYAWTDGTAAQGATYWYTLEDVALDGTATQHEPITVTVAQPNAVGLAAFGAAPIAASTPALAGLAAALAAAVLTGMGLRRRRR